MTIAIIISISGLALSYYIAQRAELEQTNLDEKCSYWAGRVKNAAQFRDAGISKDQALRQFGGWHPDYSMYGYGKVVKKIYGSLKNTAPEEIGQKSLKVCISSHGKTIVPHYGDDSCVSY